MNTEYQATIIETGLLIQRLAIQFAFLREELKRNWIEFRRNLIKFLTSMIFALRQRIRNLLSTPHFLSEYQQQSRLLPALSSPRFCSRKRFQNLSS